MAFHRPGRFACASPGAETFVDCVAEVRGAPLNGVAVPTEHIAEGRLSLTGLAAEKLLVVEAVQRKVTCQCGVQRCVDPCHGEVYVWTTFEPDDARMCWARFDQPDLKAPHACTVLAPAAVRPTGVRPGPGRVGPRGARRSVAQRAGSSAGLRASCSALSAASARSATTGRRSDDSSISRRCSR